MTPSPPARRPDLVDLVGYHSPQVDAEVRLNTNESPVGAPAAWHDELRRIVGELEFNRYPDRAATALRTGVGALHGVGPERIFCANGSNEVLQSLLLAYGGPGRSVAVFEPTYMLHTHIARITGTTVVAGARTDRFQVDVPAALDLVAEHRPVVTFLCSPNNPTGTIEPRATVEALLGAIGDGLLVVDEAYAEFSEESAIDLASGAGGERRVVVTRTFSKTWAMAGARLGYLVGDPEVVESCLSVALPYHLDAFTQAAGLAALGFAEAMEERVAHLKEERGRIEGALDGLDVEYWPSSANFVLFRPLARHAHALWAELLEHSVLVRDCSGWPGTPDCLRVTVGTAEENTRFLEALEESL